jgi:hypothetical protein
MTPEQYKPGLRVWYEPSVGIRFLGETVDESPRKLGDTWVTTVAMSSRAYGEWRRRGNPDNDRSHVRMSVPAASLDCLYLDVDDVLAEVCPTVCARAAEGERARIASFLRSTGERIGAKGASSSSLAIVLLAGRLESGDFE